MVAAKVDRGSETDREEVFLVRRPTWTKSTCCYQVVYVEAQAHFGVESTVAAAGNVVVRAVTLYGKGHLNTLVSVVADAQDILEKVLSDAMVQIDEYTAKVRHNLR